MKICLKFSSDLSMCSMFRSTVRTHLSKNAQNYSFYDVCETSGQNFYLSFIMLKILISKFSEHFSEQASDDSVFTDEPRKTRSR